MNFIRDVILLEEKKILYDLVILSVDRQLSIWNRYFNDQNMVSRAQFKKNFFIKYKKNFYSKAKGRSGPILVRYLYDCNENSSIFLQKLPEFWYFWHMSSRA